MNLTSPRILRPAALTAALMATAILPRASGENPASAPPQPGKQIRVMVEFIEVSHEQFTEMMADPRTTADDTDLRRQLAEMSKQGKAKVVETMMCLGRDGQKVTSESIEEFIYPTEYEPPELPNEIHISNNGDKTAAPGRDYATPPTPTAFETRNLGSTLEFEANSSVGGGYVDLRLTPEIVWHVGNTTWTEWKGRYGEAPIQMPTMYSLRFNVGLTLASGRPTLAAALSPKDENGHPDSTRIWMVFVRCDLLR